MAKKFSYTLFGVVLTRSMVFVKRFVVKAISGSTLSKRIRILAVALKAMPGKKGL